MNYIYIFFAALMLPSCNETDRNGNSDSGAPFIQPNDPFKNLDPEKANSSSDQNEPEKPAEIWYGIDSDFDTVIYEKDGQILTSGYVTGTFERIDRQDFMHYVIRDSNDMLHGFFINIEDQKQMDDYYEGYEPARGHPVIVKWIRAPLQVSDGGAMQTVYQAKEIIE